MAADDSTRTWVQRLRTGDKALHDELVRCLGSLMSAARRRLPRQRQRDVSASDLVQSVVGSFLRKIDAGKCDNLADKYTLRRLLHLKLNDKLKALFRKWKRREGLFRISGESDGDTESPSSEHGLEQHPDPGPTSDVQAALNNLVEQCLVILEQSVANSGQGMTHQQEILQMFAKGMTVEEIADKTGLAERTVMRRKNGILKVLDALLDVHMNDDDGMLIRLAMQQALAKFADGHGESDVRGEQP